MAPHQFGANERSDRKGFRAHQALSDPNQATKLQTATFIVHTQEFLSA